MHFTKFIKIHINQHECSHKSTFCCDGSNHGGEEEWRDDVCDYVMRIDIPGNTFFLYGQSSYILPFRLDRR